MENSDNNAANCRISCRHSAPTAFYCRSKTLVFEAHLNVHLYCADSVSLFFSRTDKNDVVTRRWSRGNSTQINVFGELAQTPLFRSVADLSDTVRSCNKMWSCFRLSTLCGLLYNMSYILAVRVVYIRHVVQQIHNKSK